MTAISASVGSNGVNDKADVTTVQTLLNTWLGATGQPLLVPDGGCGDKTIKAIKAYQAGVMGSAAPDGRVDPGGKTITSLCGGAAPAPAPAPAPGAPGLSGSAWWHANQGNYPNTNKIDDLVSPFRERARAFVDALRAAGATVTVSATRRNATRAHLMHYSWRIAKGAVAPSQVPAVPGCAITWDHGNLARSKQGAQEMVDLFDIAFQPSLTSLHIAGKAIDMTIGWTGILKIKDANGVEHAIGAPRNGNDNPRLHAVGASYGVKKLLSDPPHWSENGH